MMRASVLLGALAVIAAIPALASANHSATEHVSIGLSGSNGPFDSAYQFSSADGSHVLF